MYPSIYGCSSYHISDTYPRGKNFRFRFRAYVYVTLLSADWLFAFAGFIKRPSAYAEHRWIRWNKFLKVTQCVFLSVKCYLKKRKSFKIHHPKIDKLVTQFMFVRLFFLPTHSPFLVARTCIAVHLSDIFDFHHHYYHHHHHRPMYKLFIITTLLQLHKIHNGVTRR